MQTLLGKEESFIDPTDNVRDEKEIRC